MNKQVEVRRGVTEGLHGGRLDGGSDGAGEAAEGSVKAQGLGLGVGTALAVRVCYVGRARAAVEQVHARRATTPQPHSCIHEQDCPVARESGMTACMPHCIYIYNIDELVRIGSDTVLSSKTLPACPMGPSWPFYRLF